MMQIKMPAVSGLFYPADKAELRSDLENHLAHAAVPQGHRPVALIAPHAGYQYSGDIAGSAYATLWPYADTYHRVIVLAPSHRVAFRGIALSTAAYFRTPLGDVPVDVPALEHIRELPGVIQLDEAFSREHALEVQLPFLQRVLDDFRLVPLVIGETQDEQVSRVLEALWDDNTLIVVSSDLSHYHDYDFCRRRDAATSAHIEQLEADAISPHDACGAFPLRGLLQTAKRRGWRVQTLDLRNSGDTAGSRDRVVGYGAYAFF